MDTEGVIIRRKDRINRLRRSSISRVFSIAISPKCKVNTVGRGGVPKQKEDGSHQR